MISSKILVYHYPPSSSKTEVYRPTRRRKKSLGDLFQNGFRVRSGPSAAEKEDPQSFGQSVVSCCRVCTSWGKNPPKSILCSERLPRGEEPPLWTRGQVIDFTPLCLAYPLSTDVLAKQKPGPSFLDEYNWSLDLLNVFELLKNIL